MNGNEEQFDKVSDITENKYISHPKVGESIEIIVKGVKKNTDTVVVGKDGKKFDKKLSSVDFGIDIYDVENKVYSVRAWTVWGKIRQIFQKLNTEMGTGVKLKISHIADGMKERDKESYEVHAFVDNEWKKLNSDNEWV